ncbi:outer membrane protein assembly factor [Hymenobacter sp. BT175]|uniref:BamA/TamA family outer membrane protein n=1 Tax=Hymenobacter translucens TaxID=2886507 RepID=UPI001D0E6739|nr:BamA/TamA family outer membrane protein [Hymenobacter translucens]MCC2547512.1 outer membrane protein assembly factor [Hymenobacter translucens]
MRFAYLLFGLSLLAFRAQAQTPATPVPDSARPAQNPVPAAKDPHDKPSFIPAPVVFYEPETGLAGGAAILPVWRLGRDSATTRKSNARLVGWYSQRKQTSLQLTHTIFTPGERYLFTGELSAYDFPIFYYGTGNNTRLADESEISYQLFIVNQRVMRGFGRQMFAGLTYRLTALRNITIEEPLTRESNRPNLLLERPARERENTFVSGFGPSFLYDGRDNILSTFRGSYLEFQTLFNGKGLGSDFTFTRYQLDARLFRPLLPSSTNTIIGGQLLGQFHSGNVPFRELANLGGISVLRGIYEGRFRDRQLVVGQVELRQKLFWRLNGAVFAGAGQVADQLGDFGLSDFKLAGGAGIRFRFNRRDRLNIRFDYGVGSGGSKGLYFGVNEAF